MTSPSWEICPETHHLFVHLETQSARGDSKHQPLALLPRWASRKPKSVSLIEAEQVNGIWGTPEETGQGGSIYTEGTTL